MPPLLPGPVELSGCPGCRAGPGAWNLRDDDRPEVVNARLAHYDDTFDPLITHYRGAGVVTDIEIAGGIDVMAPKFAAAFGLDGGAGGAP